MFLSKNGLFSDIKPCNSDAGLRANIYTNVIMGLNWV